MGPLAMRLTARGLVPFVRGTIMTTTNEVTARAKVAIRGASWVGSTTCRNYVDWTAPAVYEQTMRPVNEATTMPGAVYHDQNFFDIEKKRVWEDSWVAVAEMSSLAKPGDVIPVTVGSSSIILANDGGTIRGFHNVCRHRGAQLVSKPCANRKTILCPYHRWGYALDGRLMGTPSFDADEQGRTIPEEYREKLRTHHVKDFDKKKMGLHPVRTDTALGLVFANVGGEAPLLKTWLGDILHTLEPYIPAMEGGGVVPTVHQTNYQTECNWKVLVENFVEYYHLPAVHPALCDVSGVDEHRSEQGTGMYGCFVTDPLTKGSTAIDPGRLPPWRGIEGTPNALQAYHTFIYPNVFFSVYPDHFFRVIVRPDGPTRSFESATLFTSPEALDNTAMLEEIHAFWDNVNTEDISICNAVQLGTAANVYDGGRFSFRFEEPVHRFQNMMAQMMIGGEGRYRMPQGSKDEIN